MECICDQQIMLNRRGIVKTCINYVKQKIKDMILWTHYKYVKLWPEKLRTCKYRFFVMYATYLLYCTRGAK